MRHQDEHRQATSEADGTNRPGSPRPPDDPLLGLLSRFRRRLESFGLGETQLPLLTDNVDSVDAEGNPR
jgi:hypothetical protein